MAQPVLVRAYTGRDGRTRQSGGDLRSARALPPISSYAFADILRAADSIEFQTAIDGIAEICAKNRLSLADEYGSHLPPLGTITSATPAAMQPLLHRPGMRRALTSVPEASSGSSEGSRRSLKKSRHDGSGNTGGGIFGFAKRKVPTDRSPRKIRIGSMGRAVTAQGTTALAADAWRNADHGQRGTSTTESGVVDAGAAAPPLLSRRIPSPATLSLQRLLSPEYGLHPV